MSAPDLAARLAKLEALQPVSEPERQAWGTVIAAYETALHFRDLEIQRFEHDVRQSRPGRQFVAHGSDGCGDPIGHVASERDLADRHARDPGFSATLNPCYREPTFAEQAAYGRVLQLAEAESRRAQLEVAFARQNLARAIVASGQHAQLLRGMLEVLGPFPAPDWSVDGSA